jgi:hypothetical protein
MAEDEQHTDMYHLIDALEAVITSSDPEKREVLARTIDAYADDNPDDFFWAIGAQSPVLLYQVIMTIDAACRPTSQSKPRPVIRLVDRKPE